MDSKLFRQLLLVSVVIGVNGGHGNKEPQGSSSTPAVAPAMVRFEVSGNGETDGCRCAGSLTDWDDQFPKQVHFSVAVTSLNCGQRIKRALENNALVTAVSAAGNSYHVVRTHPSVPLKPGEKVSTMNIQVNGPLKEKFRTVSLNHGEASAALQHGVSWKGLWFHTQGKWIPLAVPVTAVADHDQEDHHKVGAGSDDNDCQDGGPIYQETKNGYNLVSIVAEE